jgi:hypothetical protein
MKIAMCDMKHGKFVAWGAKLGSGLHVEQLAGHSVVLVDLSALYVCGGVHIDYINRIWSAVPCGRDQRNSCKLCSDLRSFGTVQMKATYRRDLTFTLVATRHCPNIDYPN